MDQRSRRIPREYPGSPGETKDPNRRLVIDNYDLVAFTGHQQHIRATYVRSDIDDAEPLESATLVDTIRVGSYKIINVYKPPPTDWTNAALPAHQHPAIDRVIYIWSLTQLSMWATSIATTQPGVTNAQTATATG